MLREKAHLSLDMRAAQVAYPLLRVAKWFLQGRHIGCIRSLCKLGHEESCPFDYQNYMRLKAE